MKNRVAILTIVLLLLTGPVNSQDIAQPCVDFFGQKVTIPYNKSSFVDYQATLSQESIAAFFSQAEENKLFEIAQKLKVFREEQSLEDWLFYQLVRRTVQFISPKAENYHRYTLYKWYFMLRSGYNVKLGINDGRILFYVQSDDNVYNIPVHFSNGKQYVCLNYHDYGKIDFETSKFEEISIPGDPTTVFTYKITHLPDFDPLAYKEKIIHFSINEEKYNFRIKVNPDLKMLFNNYPVLDYEFYLNIPLSNQTYQSFIPELKNQIKDLSVTKGVEYLMRFTRNAFIFETDTKNFGGEKRLTPEQTLLYDQSDCEDRVALFFYLVRETYNLPMIILTYPEHVTVAVKLEKPAGKTILYKGNEFSICEPTPQRKDLGVGQVSHRLAKSPYEVVYAYTPVLE